jgi:hypothetical protein
MQRESQRVKLMGIIGMINVKRARNRSHPPITFEVAMAAVDKLKDGYKFEYQRVIERGGRASKRLHFHLLLRGESPPEVVLGAVAHMFGFGYVCDLTKVYDQGASWYISKYLTKDCTNTGRRHKVSGSRGYDIDKPPKSPKGMWTVLGKARILPRGDTVGAAALSSLRHIRPGSIGDVGQGAGKLKVFQPWPAEWKDFWGSQPLRMAVREFEWKDKCHEYLGASARYKVQVRQRIESHSRSGTSGFLRPRPGR